MKIISKQKKIGLLIPHLQSGGAERVLAVTSEILSSKGHEVFILLFDGENISFKVCGKVIDFNSKSGSNMFSKILSRIYRIIKLSFYMKRYNLDIVISFLNSANTVNYYSFGGSAKVIACRGYSDYLKNGKRYSKMIKNIDNIIVQTERMKLDFQECHGVNSEKIKIISNPFNIQDIQIKAKEDIESSVSDFIKSHRTICTVGSFKRDKGHWHLIRSFIKVKETVKDAGLIFIGHRGMMEKQIKDMARRSGYSSDILFVGHKENPFKYLSKCDLYVSSSLNEGFPNVIVEAMACSLPVLSTDCMTGPKEILSKNSKKNSEYKDFSDYGILTSTFSGVINYNNNDFEIEEIEMADKIIKLFHNEMLLIKYKKASIIRSGMFDTITYYEKINELLN